MDHHIPRRFGAVGPGFHTLDLVHDAVNEIEGVETRSDGVEPSRFVVIQPSD